MRHQRIYRRFSLQAGFIVLALAAPSLAQDVATTSTIPQATVLECTEELFEKAEQSFQRRSFGSEMLGRAERQLSEVVRLCNGTPGSFQAKDQLRIVQEELAEHSLSIARFYLDRFYAGKSGKAGALSRLKSIIERYPHYSHLDQVLFLLGKLNMSDSNFDEAAICYRRLIRAYPGSQYAGQASLGLSGMGMLKTNISPKPTP